MKIPTVERHGDGDFRHVRQAGKRSDVGGKPVRNAGANDGLGDEDINQPKSVIEELGEAPISPSLGIGVDGNGNGSEFDHLAGGKLNRPGSLAIMEQDASNAREDANIPKMVGDIAQLNGL